MRKRAALVLVSVILLTLTACNPGLRPIGNFSGMPPEEEISGEPGGGQEDGVQAAWIEDGGRIAITIWGSSTCPTIGTDIEVVKPMDEGNKVRVKLAPHLPEACTADFVPHTTVFWTPVFVTTTQPLDVEVGGQTVTLPIK